ncbi:MAG: hypothetical protein ABW081_06610, partial [Solirubrobacteraceae bacterium]
MAIVALFMALGGTSYAALKITGKNVANSSLTGLDVKNKSLGPIELKPDSLTGDQINESALGAVPEALHAVNADNAQMAAKAADADTVGGIPAAQLMTTKTRASEAAISSAINFASGTTRGTLTDLPAGTYVVMARLNYYNPGAVGEESCTLDVPGANDVASFTAGTGESEAITLQEVVESDSLFMATV